MAASRREIGLWGWREPICSLFCYLPAVRLRGSKANCTAGHLLLFSFSPKLPTSTWRLSVCTTTPPRNRTVSRACCPASSTSPSGRNGCSVLNARWGAGPGAYVSVYLSDHAAPAAVRLQVAPLVVRRIHELVSASGRPRWDSRIGVTLLRFLFAFSSTTPALYSARMFTSSRNFFVFLLSAM